MKLRPLQAVRHESGSASTVTEYVTEEDVLQINVNGEPFTVTMRTPGDDRELVRGLLFTESVCTAPAAPVVLREKRDGKSGRVLAMEVDIPPSFVERDIAGVRSLASTSSCGLCGAREMPGLGQAGAPLTPGGVFDVALIPGMQECMRARQSTFRQSGGSHAAGAFTLSGGELAVYEDVGRHNAVDKVVGALLADGKLGVAQCLLLSGRISYEIVLKAYKAGMPFVAAVSAPSSLAVRAAEQLGMCILGFCREMRATVYTHPEYIVAAGKRGT
jgi:FdhD protein